MDNQRIKEIATQAKEKEFYADYDFIGVRIQQALHGARVGKVIAHRSHEWVDGKKLSTRLNGISAIDIEHADSLLDYGGYDGDYAIILGCDDTEGGNDIAEIVMREPVVLDIIRE
jgi:hypothetical protein